MKLIDDYKQQCEQGLIQSDPLQIQALQHFQEIADAIADYHKKSASWLRLRKPQTPKGLYIWGSVGIGKTHLMDCFYQNVDTNKKMRLHFHAFMKLVHQEMKKYRGQKNPVALVAKDLAKEHQLICFDEFYVTEVVDAMILARLLEALLENGVTFVATSNTAPDDLYLNGLQRISFLPAIALINEYTKVVHLNSDQDYRLQQVTKAGVYFTPQSSEADQQMQKLFDLLVQGCVVNEDPISLHGRWINVRKRAEQVVWFDFNDICNVPRSQQDYLSLVDGFQCFFVSSVPDVPATNRNILTLFIKFIDVLYDAQAPLFLSSDFTLEHLCRDVAGTPEYARTQSRLIEMQSEKYLANKL